MDDLSVVSVIPPLRSFKIVSKKVDYTYNAVSEYRIRMRGNYKYLIVDASLFKEEFLLQRLSDDYHLPSFMYDVQDSWTSATITVRHDYYNIRLKYRPITPLFDVTYRYTPLRGVKEIEDWVKPTVDVGELTVVQAVSDEVQVVLYGPSEGVSNVAIAKFAPFETDIETLANEVRIYRAIEGKDISPRFLGYLKENDRIVGFLLEFLEGKKAKPSNHLVCKDVLQRLHALGIAHNSLDIDSFVIVDKKAILVDFQNSIQNAAEDVLDEELNETFSELFGKTPPTCGSDAEPMDTDD